MVKVFLNFFLYFFLINCLFGGFNLITKEPSEVTELYRAVSNSVSHQEKATMEWFFYWPKRNLAYINIPKNGSTFIRKALHNRSTYINHLSSEKRQKLITLLVARNPYSRVISSYLEVIKARRDGPREITIKKNFYLNRNNVCNSFYQFLQDCKQNGFYDIHMVSQEEYFSVKNIEFSSVSFIIDFDHLEEDLLLFAKLYDLNVNLNVDHHAGKAKKKKILRKYIKDNPEVRELIQEIYSNDFSFYSRCQQRRKEILAEVAVSEK